MDLGKEDHNGVVEKTRDDVVALDQPDFREG